MITSDILLHTLIHRGKYDELRGYHEVLRQALPYMRESDQSDHDRVLLRCALDYAERYSKYPAYPELEEFVARSPHVDSIVDGQGLVSKRCHDLSSTDIPIHQGGWAQVIDEYVVAARQAMYVEAYARAAKCIAAGAELPTANGKPAPSLKSADRVAAAQKYLDDVRRNDFTLPPASPEGSLKENAPLMADAVIDSLRDTVKDRCYTGFRHIDDKLAIGPKQEDRYIGILGASHHGKSLLMRQIAYNMAASNKRILYVAHEESAVDFWKRLAWLHAWHMPELDIPPASKWKHNPKSIRPEHEDNFRVLAEDLQFGASVPGDISVVTYRHWIDVIRELNTGHNGTPYDALFIDYPAHFATGVSGDKHRGEILKIFREAQELSQTYRGGRGVVIVAAVQANKKSVAEADEGALEEWGTYPPFGSFEMYTDAQRDMDAVITVWQKGPLKSKSMMKLGCLKNRGGEMFVPHFVSIDPRTCTIHDLQGGPKSDLSKISTYRAEEAEAKLSREEIESY